MPPVGWARGSINPSHTWEIATDDPFSGTYYARIPYDDVNQQDDYLDSPNFYPTAGSVSFYSYGSTYWCRDVLDNCDLEVWFVKGTWGGGDDVLLGLADTDWTGEHVWSFSSYDFSAYADGTVASIWFKYVGLDGDEVGLDQISINYGSVSGCSDTNEPNDALGRRPRLVTVAP
jgi:hypothetical protein